MKQSSPLLFLLFLLLCLTGVFVHFSDFMAPLKTALQSDAIPEEILKYGKMGKIFKNLNLVQSTYNDTTRFPRTSPAQQDLNTITFQKKRQVGDYLVTVNREQKKSWKSRSLDFPAFLDPSLPVVSLAVDTAYLTDPQIGLLAHPDQRGDLWERPAEITYWEKRQPLFTTRVGLRLQGATQTLTPLNNYRFSFRQEYGLAALPPRTMPQSAHTAINTVTITLRNNSFAFPFLDYVAHDIAQRLGCLVPRQEPAYLIINGKLLGLGILSEHLNRRQWRNHTGHDPSFFFELNGENNAQDEQLYRTRVEDLVRRPEKLLMERVAQTIDLENLSRHILCLAWCGAGDPGKGAAVLNSSSRPTKLQWTTEQVSLQIEDRTDIQPGLLLPAWQQPGFTLLFKRRHENPKALLFYRLFTESPKYRLFFLQLVRRLLKHELSIPSLQERLRSFRLILRAVNPRDDIPTGDLQRYLLNRNSFLLRELSQLTGSQDPSLPVSLYSTDE